MKELYKILVLLLVSIVLKGQDKTSFQVPYDVTCTYQLAFYPDSTKSDSKTEMFYLFINSEKSLFKSKNRYLNDSVLNVADGSVANRQNSISFLRQHPTEFNISIIKRGCNNITTTDLIYHNYFSYPELPGHMQWVLSEDIAKISGYSCQKATTEFGGRKWTAWFTEAIPVSDGPHKFCGLPGLIVRLTDSKAHYDFLLNELKQTSRVASDLPVSKVFETSKGTFFKKRREYNENPIGIAEQSGVVFTSGRSEIKQRVQEKIRAHNNPIEFFPD